MPVQSDYTMPYGASYLSVAAKRVPCVSEKYPWHETHCNCRQGWPPGVPIRTDIAASEPAVIGAIVIRTAGLRGVDGASAPAGEGAERRWRPWRLGAALGILLTRGT